MVQEAEPSNSPGAGCEKDLRKKKWELPNGLKFKNV